MAKAEVVLTKLSENVIMHVTVRVSKILRVRVYLALILISLASRLLGCSIIIEGIRE